MKEQHIERLADDDSPLPDTNVFYTRQLYLPILVTVYQNLEPLNWDILYLRHNRPISPDNAAGALERVQHLSLDTGSTFHQPVEDLLTLTQISDDSTKNDYCLVTLDVRNIWTVPFDTEVTIDNSPDLDGSTPVKSIVTIHPGSTKRLVLPVKRLFLPHDTCIQPVPSLEPNKQFVVSQAPKMPPGQERLRLQLFWYREHLLKRIKAVWRCGSTGRHGLLNLRPSLRLMPTQLNVLKKEDIEFIVDMEGARSTAHRRFTCKVNDFVTMYVRIRNHNGKQSLQ